MMRRLRLVLLRLLGAILNRRPPHEISVQRVLVIKPDHLGDVLLLTPALRLLRQQLPAAQITLLIGPWSTAAVAHTPDVNTIHTLAFPGFTRAARRSGLHPYGLLLKWALLLRLGRYDAALIARDDHWWGALLALLAGIPQRVGYAVPEVAPLLTAALPHTFNAHVTDQSIALVAALCRTNLAERPPLRAPCDKRDHAWAEQWLRLHEMSPDRPLFAIHPGAGGPAKLWLPSRWAAVADALHETGSVVLTGGPAEQALIAEIAQQMAHRPHTLVGAATLGQLTALYSRCALVLGVDSGPLHFAVAAGVPTIALFGPGDHRRFGPWGDPQQHRVVRSGLWCSPCGVLDACPRGTAPSECMARISVQHVAHELAEMDLLARD